MTDAIPPLPELPQPPAVPEMLELTAGPVPLLEQARERVGHKVIVYIAGGIQVDGKLVDVDDDELVITVDDNDHRHWIAIESIAVLAVKR